MSRTHGTDHRTHSGHDLREQLIEAMPVVERRLELAGVSTAVLEGGEGPPVVLLHGLGEFAAVWIHVIAPLTRTHRVVVPDLPGHGASVVTDNPLDAEGAGRWLDALLEATCEQPAALVGHLLGGSLAARHAAGLAAGHDAGPAASLSHLVLVDTLGLTWFRPAPRFAIPMMGFVLRPTEDSRDRLFNQCFMDMDRVGDLAGHQWATLRAYALDRAKDPAGQAALRRLVRVAAPPIPASALARIEVPTTLIHGRHDLQVSLRTVQAASARYGWPLHVIDACRDDPAAEQPEAFLSALRSAIDVIPDPDTEEAS